DRIAKRFAPGFMPAEYRWAALRLRKSSRELVDEVKQYHFIFARRDFARFQSLRQCNTSRFDGQPGIYLLRHTSKQPLYIGQTIDMDTRLAQHVQTQAISDAAPQIALIMGDELPGLNYQAAFKEDLVRRYQPRWNVNLVGLQRSQPMVSH